MRIKMKNELNIPFQVETLIQNLSNNRESVYLRGNYRMRLVAIKDAIDKAVQKYDNEVHMANYGKKKTKA